MPPYAPGGEDTWDNLWLQRSAAHPWCGMRNMAALIGSGVMDRYPGLRIGTLEAGHGWLPFWIAPHRRACRNRQGGIAGARAQAQRICFERPLFPEHRDPRRRAADQLRSIDLLGDDVLMYASDYPHGESWFPKSATTGARLEHAAGRASASSSGTTPCGSTRAPAWRETGGFL